MGTYLKLCLLFSIHSSSATILSHYRSNCAGMLSRHIPLRSLLISARMPPSPRTKSGRAPKKRYNDLFLPEVALSSESDDDLNQLGESHSAEIECDLHNLESRPSSESGGFDPEDDMHSNSKRGLKSTSGNSEKKKKKKKKKRQPSRLLRKKEPNLWSRQNPNPRHSASKDIERAKQPLKDPTRRIKPSKHTPCLNKWIDGLSGLTEIVTVTPSALPSMAATLLPLGEPPIVQGRRFACKIEGPVEIEITWDPPKYDEAKKKLSNKTEVVLISTYRKNIRTWRVWVYNSALPPSQQVLLRLFPELNLVKTKKYRGCHNTFVDYRWWCTGGPLDDTVCPDKGGFCKVAAEACNLLDRCPREIDESQSPSERNLGGSEERSGMRTVIELQALRTLRSKNKEFDFRNIRPCFRSADHNMSYYCVHPESRARTIPAKKTLPSASYTVVLPIHLLNPSGTGDLQDGK